MILSAVHIRAATSHLLPRILLAAMAAFIFLAPGTAAAVDVVAEFSTLGRHKVLTPYVSWQWERGEAWTAEEAAARYEAGAFQQAQDEWLELGIMQGTLWIAATIRNATPEDRLVLEFRNPRVSYADLFVPDGEGGYTAQFSGTARPFEVRLIQHPMPAFPLHLEQGETATVLLRIQNIGDMRARIWLWDAAAFYNRMASAYYPELITVGILLVLALFHLLVFLSLREKGYLYLFFFITSWLLFFMASNGTGHMLVWGDMQWLALRANTVFLILTLASFILFTMAFLESHKHTPWLYYAGLALVALCAVHLIYASFTESIHRIIINRYLTLAVLSFVGLLVFAGIWRGSRMALFFLASWIFLLAGSALMLLLSWYLVSANWVLNSPLVNLLFTTSILIWSFELTGRVKGRAAEQRRLLEEQVRERTHALETALREVKTLSGLLPICSNCKKIRDDSGYWSNVEHYVSAHTDANFTHGICPDCFGSLYPEIKDRRKMEGPGANQP